MTSLTSVTPPQLLAAGDARVRRRRVLQRRHPCAVVVGGARWQVLDEEVHNSLAGPEVQLVLEVPGGDDGRPQAAVVKRPLVGLEESRPGGRLWDLDVHDGEHLLSRTSLGLPPRRRLVCDGPAHACARSRAHDASDRARAVEVLRAAHR